MTDPKPALIADTVAPCGDYQCRCCHLWKAEVERHRAANLVRAVVRYDAVDEWIVEAINAESFDRVPWRVAERLAEENRQLRARLTGSACACGHAVESHQGKGNFCLVEGCQCVEFVPSTGEDLGDGGMRKPGSFGDGAER